MTCDPQVSLFSPYSFFPLLSIWVRVPWLPCCLSWFVDGVFETRLTDWPGTCDALDQWFSTLLCCDL